MKKLNRKGFTLIELLAVITIMGILMLVAIPAVSRTIENTRRDTFASTAKSYINAMKNSVAADEIYVGNEPISAMPDGYYYYGFDTEDGTTATDLMEQGGRSSWGNANVKGYIAIHKTVTDEIPATQTTPKVPSKTKYEYAIFLVDSSKHGLKKLTLEKDLKRAAIVTNTGSVVGKTQPTGVSEDKFNSNDETGLTALGESPTCTPVTIG